MKPILFFCAVSLGALGIACGSNDPTAANLLKERQAEIQLVEEREQKLLGRIDEFSKMTPPLKPNKPYFVKDAVILIRMPGRAFEIQGWEKDDKGELKKCLFSKCNGREVIWVKDMIPKVGVAKSVVRADCRQGKKLMELELVAIAVGPLFATECSITVIDLETQTTIDSRNVVFEKVEKSADGSIRDESLVSSNDKKSYFVAPYRPIGDLVFELGKSK